MATRREPCRHRLAGDCEARPSERARMVRRPSRCAHSARGCCAAGHRDLQQRKPLLKSKVCCARSRKPTETVAPTLPSTANGVKVASLRSSRPSSYALDTLQGLDVLFVQARPSREIESSEASGTKEVAKQLDDKPKKYRE